MTDDILGFGGEIDLFGREIDFLVVTVYDATIQGIDALDKSAREGFKTAKWSHPDEESQERAWWDEQLSLLRYQAGNMALVSIVTLFDDWMDRHGAKRPGIKGRFEELEHDLGRGPLSLARFENILHARDSIIHH